jgi:hypothetical protein
MSKRASNIDPVSGIPLSGWQGLINRPRGEAANTLLQKAATTGKTAPLKPASTKIEIPDGYAVVFSMPQGSLSWIALIKKEPWL